MNPELNFSANALTVLKKRYLLKDKKGRIIENPVQLFRRVASAVAAADGLYAKERKNKKHTEQEFFDVMSRLEFLPNSPTLMNAGTPLGQLSACFVLPVPDSMEGIFETMKAMALIHQSGGGTGFSFSSLRPKGDVVKTTHGVASGPVSFMSIFDEATEVIKQGGRRRGANMGMLSVDHPDIIEFISSKESKDALNNFNISVSIPDKFFTALKKSEKISLVNPRSGRKTAKLSAKKIFDLISAIAWKTGDPGIVFIDAVNRANPVPAAGRMESTNPCGEQPLLPYESCNLGSINLARFIGRGRVNWGGLKKLIDIAVHFLDNVIDVNKFPIPEIELATKKNRKIGLGVMGFAEALILMGIPYNSEKALSFGRKIMKFIQKEARSASVRLGKLRGSFPNFSGSIWKRKKHKCMRNATVTTVAPTGSISLIADVSSGIEPMFAVSFIRDVMDGTKLVEVKEVPAKLRRLYVTALEILPEWHVKMQAAFQKYTDNAVSKTVNLPEDSTVSDVKKIFKLAHKLKCKGITIFRYGSRPEQVLYTKGE